MAVVLIVLGVDPGSLGGLAWVCDGELIGLIDMPSKTVVVSGSERMRVDEYQLGNELLLPKVDHVYIENVGSHPRESGAAGFAFGLACGIVRGVLGAYGIPYTLVTPQEWRRAMGSATGKTKAESKTNSRLRAMDLFPEFANSFKRVKDADKAEACLIALFGYQQTTKGRA